MYTSFSESMTGFRRWEDRQTRIVNGPARVHPKLRRVGWNGCHRYMAMVSEKNLVPEREAYLQVASESISSRNG